MHFLTTQMVADLQHDPAKVIVKWDAVVPRFGVRLERSGKKVWIVRYIAFEMTRIMQIGSCGLMTLDEARKVAADIKLAVQGGADPLARRKEQRKALKKRNPTFSDFSKFYMEEHAKVHKKSWHKDQRMLDMYLNPAFGKKHLSEIDRDHVLVFHTTIGKKYPILANRLCEILSKMFTLAVIHNYIDNTRPNPTLGVQQFKEVSRDRWLRPDELERVMKVLVDEPDPYLRAYFPLVLHTCLRKSELLTLKWSQIDLYMRELTLPDSKAGRPHYLPLTDEALAIFNQIPRIEGNPYVFCGRIEGQCRNTLDKAWQRIRRRAGVTDATIHDLRRTGASILAQNGVSLAVIAQILNQSNERVTAVYARFAKQNLRVALEANSKIIASQLGAANFTQATITVYNENEQLSASA